MEKEETKIPKHVGIIMDGNRRWAKERNLPRIEGHRKGYHKLKQVPEWFFSKGVETLSVFAFSMENWKRSQEEVNYLMKLLKRALKNDIDEFNKRQYKLILSGRIDELPGDLPEICRDAIFQTRDNDRGVLNLCINYGGQTEIVDVVKKIIKNKIDIDQVHEGMIQKYLYHGELGNLDMVIRTSGEQCLSGFLLWASAYSELMFMDKYWPDFERGDVDGILNEYSSRTRRLGGE